MFPIKFEHLKDGVQEAVRQAGDAAASAIVESQDVEDADDMTAMLFLCAYFNFRAQQGPKATFDTSFPVSKAAQAQAANSPPPPPALIKAERWTRWCSIEDASCDDGHGRSEDADMSDVSGLPDEIGKQIADCLHNIDLYLRGQLLHKDFGRDLWLNLKILISREPAVS